MPDKKVSVDACNRVGMILSWHKQTAVNSVSPSEGGFFGGFSAFLQFSRKILIHNGIWHFSILCYVWKSSKTVQNGCKIVYFASSLSQSCSTKKYIWRHYIDYLALLNTQNDTLTGYDRHRNLYFPDRKTWFSCIGDGAWKCQPWCHHGMIMTLVFWTKPWK